MKKKSKWLLLNLVLGLAILGSQPHQAKAAITDQTHGDYSIHYIAPPEQVTTERFYHVQYQPATKNTIRAEIVNYTDHTIRVKSALKTATTSDGGGLRYTTDTNLFGSTLKHPLSKIGAVNHADRDVSIPANSHRFVTATIRAPEKPYSGFIEGQWAFEQVKAQKERQGIQAKYAYGLGVIVESTHPKIYPTLKYMGVEPMLDNGFASFGIQFKNPDPMLIHHADIKASVQRQGLFKQKYYREIQDVVIAPDSNFRIPVSVNYDRLRPGKYHVEVKVTAKNYWNGLPLIWKFNKEITIPSDRIAAVNRKAIGRPTNKWAYSTGIFAALSLITGGIYFGLRKK